MNQRTSHPFVHHHERWQYKKQKPQTTYIKRFISSLKLSKDGAFCEWDVFFSKTISYMVVMDHLKNITISFFHKQSLCHLILAMQLNTEKHVLVLELTVISNAFLYNLIAISEFKIWIIWSNGQLLALNLELLNCQN